jgi:hypothetical protein
LPGAQGLDDGQRDRLLGGAGGEQIPRAIGERFDVVAQAPGHGPRLRRLLAIVLRAAERYCQGL